MSLINNQILKIQKKEVLINKRILKSERTLIQTKKKKKYKLKKIMKEFIYINLEFNFQVYHISPVNQ